MNDNYIIEKEEYISEFKINATLLRHKKSGARVLLMPNDDENKVFAIGFRTPVNNSKGVPHILEHSVLCGSERFPVSDPFMQLAKSSLKTFLNAMTFADKTLYPVASCNDKDLQNLMSVYMDAVFKPNIYNEENIFKQEGWRYELEKSEDELKLNGVVYSEMKGALSDVEAMLERFSLNSLYPDTTYGFESGGDPKSIPELTYEEFVDFHKKYYHPSNSYIYLYGDMDMDEKLDWIDKEYLSKYDAIKVDSKIEKQKAFAAPRECQIEYPISADEDAAGKAWISEQWSIGNALDNKLYYALQILEYVLVGAEGAPLREALIKSGIAEDAFGDQLSDIYQPFFKVTIKNTDPDKKDEFLHIVEETLKKIVAEGIEKRSLEAAINNMEFKIREGNFLVNAKGLMYCMIALESWLYDDGEPVMHLRCEETFKYFREHIEDGYFEELIQKYFLDNTHRSVITLVPVPGLASKEDEKLKEELAAYKASLSDEEINKLIEDTKSLREYQEREESEEALATLPHLELSDIKEGVPDLMAIEDKLGKATVLHANINTNGIDYIELLYDANDFTIDEMRRLALLADIITLMDTEKYSYAQLSDEINYTLGDLSYATSVREHDKTGEIMMHFTVSSRFLHEKRDEALELISEITYNTIYDDEKRLIEILKQIRSRMEMRSQGSAHILAFGRALAYASISDYITDETSGIGYLRYIRDITENIEESVSDIIKGLKEISKKILDDTRLRVGITADDEGYPMMKKSLEKYYGQTAYVSRKFDAGSISLVQKNEGFKTPSPVNYVAMAGSYKDKGLEYHGALDVLKGILSNEYLWNALRVKGGAYGAMCTFTLRGTAMFVSYRDPNLKNTIDVYKEMADYIENFDTDERTMKDLIISVIGNMEMPHSPFALGVMSISNYLTGRTKEDRLLNKKQILSCTPQTIRSFAPYVRAVIEKNQICVVGSAVSIDEANDVFMKVENLL